MPVLGLHDAQVFCPPGGEAAARRFYSGQLGLREVPKPASLMRSEDATLITGWIRCYVFGPFGNKIELDQTE